MNTNNNKTITLNFTNYILKGEATINLWGGGQGNYPMYDIELDNIDNITLNTLNDGGFGCESIAGAYIVIYENYEGFLKPIDHIIVGDYIDPDFNEIEVA